MILLLNSDTTAVDTSLYEVPPIIDYTSTRKPIIEIKFDDYDYLLSDALFPFDLTILECGYGRFTFLNTQPIDPLFNKIHLNGYNLNYGPFGDFNLVCIPAHFINKATLSKEVSGPCINLSSRVNQFPRPFSYIRYGSGYFGENFYDFGLSRPITDETGFYIDGQYHKYDGFSVNQGFQLFSLYTNIYDYHFIPMRLDIFYSTDGYNSPVDSSNRMRENFFDFDLILKKKNHKFLFNSNIAGIPDRALRKYRLGVKGDYDLRVCSLFWNISGFMSQIEYFGFRPDNRYHIDAGLRLTRTLGSFEFSPFGYAAYTDINSYYNPGIDVGFYIIDSTKLNISIYRDFQEPFGNQSADRIDTLYPLFKLKGNQNLKPADYLYQCFQIQSPRFFFNLYRINYENAIIPYTDSGDIYYYKNFSGQPTIGLSGYIDLPLEFTNADTSIKNRLSIRISGRKLFNVEPFPFIPRDVVKVETWIMHNTERFGAGLRFRYESSGSRAAINGQEHAGFQNISGGLVFRFINLYLYLRAENLLDADYAVIPRYKTPPRSFGFTLKWKFWN